MTNKTNEVLEWVRGERQKFLNAVAYSSNGAPMPDITKEVEKYDTIIAALRAKPVDVDVEEHCKDCCCARSWKALGITEYTGKSIAEHIEDLRAENLAALQAHKPVDLERIKKFLVKIAQRGYDHYHDDAERMMIYNLINHATGRIAPEPISRPHENGLWKDIETAPRDGSYILLYNRKSKKVQEGKFHQYGVTNVWRVRAGNVWDLGKVTHWMPLPAAPKINEGVGDVDNGTIFNNYSTDSNKTDFYKHKPTYGGLHEDAWSFELPPKANTGGDQ